MNKAYATLAAILLSSAPALAVEGQNWTGCYVGLQGGYTTANTDIGIGGLASIDGIGSQGAEFVPVAGCDAQVFDRFVLGGFVDYALRSVDTKVSLGGSSVTVGLEDAWSIGGRAGVLVNPSTLAYGLVAYQHTDFDDAGAGLISDLSGVAVGGGIETVFSPGWSLRAEYRFVSYDDKDLGGVGNLDTEEHAFRAGLIWRFH